VPILGIKTAETLSNMGSSDLGWRKFKLSGGIEETDLIDATEP